MVYEWSIPLGPSGADCAGNLLYVVTGLSHHSPLKEELGLPPAICGDPENDCFPDDGSTPDPLSDYGDLPDGYGTTAAAGGPFHNIKVSGPYLGQAVVFEVDGQPTPDATGDGDEEDGITAVLDSDWTAGSTQTIDVVVGNAPTGALLGAWFDWNSDGDLDGAGEFFSWTVSEGTNSLPITVGSGFDWFNDTLHARFRLFSSDATAPGGSLDQTDSIGEATDGEVEDYVWDNGTLPVTLSAFSSTGETGGEMTFRWQTASETDNIGFELWGRVGGSWQILGDFVESRNTNSRLPHDYEIVVETPPSLTQVQLVDFNSRGVIERYGPFRPGAGYGELQPARRIDWTEARLERVQRLQARGFDRIDQGTERSDTWKHTAGVDRPDSNPRGSNVHEVRLATTQTGEPGLTKDSIAIDETRMTHVAVTEPGVQRVTYDALRDGGLDLAGELGPEIAVSFRGSPVARWIAGPSVFGPGSAIEFIGSPPVGEDALYIGANHYQVSVDRELVAEADEVAFGGIPRVSPKYSKSVTVDRPLMHHSQSPTGDPWVERTVLARSGAPATVTLEVDVDDEVLDGKHRLELVLGTITDLPDATGVGGSVVPEHNVEVWFSGPGSGFEPIATSSTSGQRKWSIEADLPDGALDSGLNRIQLRFSTEYIFSLIVIDSYGLRFETPYRGPALDFAPDPRAQGYRVDGFTHPDVVAYSQMGADSLTRHHVSLIQSQNGFVAGFRQQPAIGSGRSDGTAADGRFWVTGAPHHPAVFTTEASGELLSGPADLVVIAESSFVGTPALDDYLEDKSRFNPVVVDVEDIYNAVGYGMALPGAITDYLAARREIHPFGHVQLVGADCYDRRNYISNCVSFIPLPTAAVGPTRFSPSHNRLADLDRDGVADVAVGQFSVRTEDELRTIVDKGWRWRSSGLSSENSALLIAEESDGAHDFLAQVHRVGNQLQASDEEILDLSEHPDILTAREALRASLDTGRTVTVFSGHSSAVQWAYRGLMTSSTVAGLTNVDHPTLMLPLACETSYDSSPSANVLGHQLLYAGGQGALAISGAVSLSNLDDNERMAGHILAGLKTGLTLGEAVQAGREALGTTHQVLQDNWLTQGDATLKLER